MIIHYICLSIFALIILIIQNFYGSFNTTLLKPTRSLFVGLFVLVIIEEILFRDYLMTKMTDYENKEILNGILFGLIHVPNIFLARINTSNLDKLVYIFLGCPILAYMGYICALQNSLIKAIIFHTVYNFVALIIRKWLSSIKINKYKSLNIGDGNSNLFDLDKKYFLPSKRRNSIPIYPNDAYTLIDRSGIWLKPHKSVENLWINKFDKFDK
jgi:hypothetical protein